MSSSSRPLISLVDVAVATLLVSLVLHERRRSSPVSASLDMPAPAAPQRSLMRRVWTETFEDRIPSEAAGVTFYALLSVFPTLAAVVSLYGLVADARAIGDHLTLLTFALPAGAVAVVGEQVARIVARPTEALGLAFLASLALSLWSANAAMKALFDALNVVYEVRETRSFVFLNAQTLLFTLCAIGFVLAALAGVIVVPAVLAFVGLGQSTEALLSLSRWPLLALALMTGLLFVYRFGPSRPPERRRWPGWGVPIAAVAWLGVSMLFSWYVAGFGSYDETYGSLGAGIGFMTWIWLSAIVILLGAEIDSESRRVLSA
ncbi:MAG: YihY/virulence factor BrkB family protein [Alphaproteobacteria bacterium]